MNVTVPAGGYAASNGVILSKSEVTLAVAVYAQKTGYSKHAVRTTTTLFRAACERRAEWMATGVIQPPPKV